ncbi:SCAN domain-containing protein 3-like [Schistocerca serialis cubense]|uniref:SCAN domain-containing protein 3-like n=1 Tax=Schistocerca serialis cubense TaxID=2023355 RepID=UPI00214F4B48|nr:SCAN domain-containing protein 3-like [Schistocerca serialis cubense]
MAHFSLFVRYCTNDGVIEEDFLAIITMNGHTKGYGCPSMTGVNNGLIALIKKEWNLPNLLYIHGLLHQKSMACQISNTKLKNVMQTVISVINFELQACYSDVLLHTAVRWLSKGKVLERFVNLKSEIILFLQQSGKNYPELDGDECQTAIININELEDLSNFPTVAMLRSGLTVAETIYQNVKENLEAYLEEIKNIFADVGNIRSCFILVENPWHVDLKFFCQFGFPKTNLLNEIIELQHDTQHKALFIEHRETQQNTEFCKCVPNNYKNLQDCVQFILTLFPSTYLCEASFSKMKYLEKKYCNRLSSHLEDAMRIACSPDDTDIDDIAKKVQHHKPH